MKCSLCNDDVSSVDLLDHLRTVHENLTTAVTQDESQVVALLHEWYSWWLVSPNAPAKMPDALHIRSALVLQELGYDVAPDSLEETELPPDTSWVETVEIRDYK